MTDFGDSLKKANAEIAKRKQDKETSRVVDAAVDAKTKEMLPGEWKLIVNSVRALTEGQPLGTDHIHWATEHTAQAGNVTLALVNPYKKYEAHLKHGENKRNIHLYPELKHDNIVWSVVGSHLSQKTDMTTIETSESVANELIHFYQTEMQ